MRNKVDSYLGFSARSRTLVSGYYSCLNGMKQKKLKLLILAEDLSENTVKKITKVSSEFGVPIRFYGKSENLSQITGCHNRGIYGVTDVNFADAIVKELDGN